MCNLGGYMWAKFDNVISQQISAFNISYKNFLNYGHIVETFLNFTHHAIINSLTKFPGFVLLQEFVIIVL